MVTGGAPRLETDHVRDHVLSFDHVTGKWNQLTKIPAPRHHHAGSSIIGYIVIVTEPVAYVHIIKAVFNLEFTLHFMFESYVGDI